MEFDSTPALWLLNHPRGLCPYIFLETGGDHLGELGAEGHSIRPGAAFCAGLGAFDDADGGFDDCAEVAVRELARGALEENEPQAPHVRREGVRLVLDPLR